MGFTKNKGLSVVIVIISVIVFNLFAFIMPASHTVLFWIGYGFATFSQIFLLISVLCFLNKTNIDSKFHDLPSVNILWIYFVVQTVISVMQMTGAVFTYASGIITDCLVSAVFAILFILLYAAKNEIKRVSEETAQNAFFIKNLQAEAEMLRSDDINLEKNLRKLEEIIRFSDPISHSQIADIEDKITGKFGVLQDSLNNKEIATVLCDELERLFEQRNKKCKLLKGVAEPASAKDNSGIKIAGVAFGVVGLAAVGILTTIFVIIPNNKYKEALDCYFNEEYEEAILLFSELGNYKDSMNKIEQAKEKITEEKYEYAEKLYENQQFVEAVDVYKKLGDYNDSKDKIEHIYNMLTKDGEVYFGEYKGNPIPWKILETHKDKMLLMTDYPIESLAFHDELKNITWETSYIREWLNSDFISDFSDKQKSRIIKNTENKLNDKIFILTQEEYNKYVENISFITDSDWWLRDKTSSGMMYVYGDSGEVNTTGESVIRAMGVRPCVWVELK